MDRLESRKSRLGRRLQLEDKVLREEDVVLVVLQRSGFLSVRVESVRSKILTC